MASLDGFGFPTFCNQKNEAFLSKANETQKLSYATATTINMLIPILISIQKLPTATIHELVLRGYGAVAIITAGLTFGLPVIQEPSRPALKAADYLKEDSSQNKHVGNSHPQTRWNKHVSSSVFALFQLLIVLCGAILPHATAKSENLGLWACSARAKMIWHIMFFSPIPVVGILWYCFLRWTYRADNGVPENGQLVVYCRRHWVQPVVLLSTVDDTGYNQ